MALSASGNLDLTDFGTARGRAGYVIGNFLPYGFIGMAVGRASYSVSTACRLTSKNSPLIYCVVETNVTQRVKISSSLTAPDKTTRCFGATRSAPDLDWALTPNIFARGEFEFVQFAPITNIAVSVASGRVGAGFKF